MSHDDEFYVGYAPHPPPGLKRILVRVVLGLNAVAALLSVLLVFGQQRFAASAFEFQQYRDFQGILEEAPYPALLVRRPGAAEGIFPFSRYLLVAVGKHGASQLVSGLDGRKLRLRGSLIYRNGDTMIELAPGSVPTPEDGGAIAAGATDLGAVTLSGEIVDSKCYFGVMNPGNGKVHRDCAVRCISGGIPPAFIVKDAAGQTKTLLLAGADGRQLDNEVLDFVAEPLTISGQLTKSGETYILRAEPGSFVRQE